MENLIMNQVYNVIFLICLFSSSAYTADELNLKNRMNQNIHLVREYIYNTYSLVENENRIRRDLGPLNSDPCITGYDCDINRNISFPHCYCDNQCKDLNDCCYNIKTEVNVSQEEPTALASVRQFLQCKHNIIIENREKKRGVYMVSVCSSSFFNETLAKKCNMSKEDDIPVTDENDIVYANRFCALCHGARSVREWGIIIKAYKDNAMEYLLHVLENGTKFRNLDLINMKLKGCQIGFLPPKDSKYRICYGDQHIFSVSNIFSCSSYLNPVEVIFSNFVRQIYHNFHCLTNVNNIIMTKCVSDIVLYGKQGIDKNYYPLTAIFSVYTRRFVNIFQTAVSKSTSDINSKNLQKEDDCFSNSSSEQVLTENYPIQHWFVFSSNSYIEDMPVKRLITFLISCFPDGLLKPVFFRYFIGRSQKNVTYGGTIKNIVKISFKGVITKSIQLSEIKKVQEKINQIELSYSEETKFVNRGNIIHFRKENKTFSKENVSYIWFHEGHCSNDMIQYILALTDDTKINKSNCIPSSCSIETMMFHNNQSKLTDIALTKHHCEFETKGHTDNQVQFTEKTSESYIFFTQTIITYACLGLSSFAALNTFWLFQKLDLFKTTAGVISLNILIVIFMFNICFMFGTGLSDSPVICFVAGVITHYLALSYFLWITMFVLHTVYTIKTVKTYRKSNPNDKTKSLHLRICLLGYISPIIVVLPSVIIDSCNCVDIEIGYSGGICFPTNFPSNLVVFIIPTGICILINVICLLYSITVLSKLNDFMIHEGLQKSRSYMVVFLRMCCVSALSWILGIISGIFSSVVVDFCFIILSGLHGFMICICLLSTKVFRDALQTYRNRNTTPGTEIEMIGQGVIENNVSSKSNQV